MKTEWTTYLESIGIQELFLKRAEEVIDFYQQIYPDQIEDIFVTEYFDKEGNRQYESLWLFSKTWTMEAKLFLTQDDFDATPLKNQVKYWCIKKTEYNFRESSAKSRMTIEFILLTGISGTLKASGKNCDHLKTVLLKHFMPNAIKYPVAAQQIDSGDGQ